MHFSETWILYKTPARNEAEDYITGRFDYRRERRRECFRTPRLGLGPTAEFANDSHLG
jgi:hypothetical protein